jgi:hypothetical protein
VLRSISHSAAHPRPTAAPTDPTGVTPAVTVSDPASFQRTLTATQTLTNLAPGSYTVTATNVTTTDPIVPSVDRGIVPTHDGKQRGHPTNRVPSLRIPTRMG